PERVRATPCGRLLREPRWIWNLCGAVTAGGDPDRASAAGLEDPRRLFVARPPGQSGDGPRKGGAPLAQGARTVPRRPASSRPLSSEDLVEIGRAPFPPPGAEPPPLR